MFHPFPAMPFDISKVLSIDRKIAAASPAGFFVHVDSVSCRVARLLFQRTHYFDTVARARPLLSLPPPWARSTAAAAAAAAAGSSHPRPATDSDRPTRKMGDKERPSSLAPWQETKSYFRKLVLVSLQWVDPDFAIKLIITDVGTLTCVKIKAFFSFVRWMHMMNREQLTCVASKRKCGARRREKIIARGV